MIKYLALVLMLIKSQMAQQQPQAAQKLSNQFTLIFKYGASANITLIESKGTVLWNDVIIFSINPSNYKITTVTISLIAEVGMNYLQFEGNGGGLTIGNIQLLRKGIETNIVINGGFEFSSGYGYTGRGNSYHSSSIRGWKVNSSNQAIYMHNGNYYNFQWKGERACLLYGQKNYILTQEFIFDNHFNVIPAVLIPLKFILQVDWAWRQNQTLETSQGTISFNGKILDTLISKQTAVGINYGVYQVQLAFGDNKLAFDGNSLSDGFGISIGFVRLSRPGKDQNLIQNSDFSEPFIPRRQFKHFKGGIIHWSGSNLQVGDCKIYNRRWRGGQCIELDSDKNQRYTQNIKVQWPLYKRLRDNLPLDQF